MRKRLATKIIKTEGNLNWPKRRYITVWWARARIAKTSRLVKGKPPNPGDILLAFFVHDANASLILAGKPADCVVISGNECLTISAIKQYITSKYWYLDAPMNRMIVAAFRPVGVGNFGVIKLQFSHIVGRAHKL